MNWVRLYRAMYLKTLNDVSREQRPSLMTMGTHSMLATLEVKGETTEASAWESEMPTSAAFRAPQSLAPSPHMPTQYWSFCSSHTSSVFCSGAMRAKMVPWTNTLGSSLGKCFTRTLKLDPLRARWLDRGSGSMVQLAARSGPWAPFVAAKDSTG